MLAIQISAMSLRQSALSMLLLRMVIPVVLRRRMLAMLLRVAVLDALYQMNEEMIRALIPAIAPPVTMAHD